MFSALRPILNKGGAGRYVTRAESVVRLLPVAEAHLTLLAAYDAAFAAMPVGPARERIAAVMPLLRTEVSKISETLLSYGATPPSGMSTPAQPAASDPTDALLDLADRERIFAKELSDEVDAVHHQERTRAILGHNAAASGRRLGVLRELTAGAVRTA